MPCRPVRFGDAVKAERTLRNHAQAKARGGLTVNESDAAARAKRRILDDDNSDDAGDGPVLPAEVLAAIAAR